MSLSSFQSLSARVESTIDHLNSQFGAIDTRLAEMSEEMAQMQAQIATLPAMRAAIDSKVDADAHSRRSDESRADIAEHLSALKNDKASKSVVNSLEQSQHRLVEEVLALQKVLGCKIDRVEVPLLDVASEKLQFLLDFQASADARLDKTETDVSALSRALQTKESKETADKKVVALREEISRKVDGEFVRAHVLQPLNETQDEIVRLKASEEALERLMADYHAHIEKFTRSEKMLADVRNEAAKCASAVRGLAEDLGRKSDRSEIDSIVFENSDEVEKIVRNYESKSAHEAKVQAAYLSDVRLQLEEMQAYQNQTDQKLQMALKFIDWFTDVKMKHQ